MSIRKNEYRFIASILANRTFNARAIGPKWAIICLIVFVAGLVALPNGPRRVRASSNNRFVADSATPAAASAERAGRNEAKVRLRARALQGHAGNLRLKPHTRRGVDHEPLLGKDKKKIKSPIAKELQGELQPFDSPGEAQEFYFLKRAPIAKDAVPDGVKGSNLQRDPIPVERYSSAIEQIKNMPQYSTALDRSFQSENEVGPLAPILGTWTPIGPGNVGGRTRGLVIDPSNANIMYAAGVAGGVWKSTNGGTSWTPLNDLMANLAVSSLAMDPNNSSILYAGTGEGYFNIDAVRGNGIFKTTNGGTSWTQLANTSNSSFFFVNDIVVSKGNSQRVYAGTSNGVWRSVDGGTNWTQVHNPGQQGGCMDLAIRTDNLAQDVVLASFGNFVQASVYRNLDAGGAGVWTAVLSDSGMGRASLAIAPSNQQTMYALAANFNGTTFKDGLQGVFRSTDGGGTWAARVRNTSPSKINTVLLSNPRDAYFTECGFGTSAFNNQGWYDNVIAVDPLDPNRVWVGGIDTFRSDDGGANFGIASHWWATTTLPRYAHSDNHAIVFDPGFNGTTNKIMYLGSDGGLFKTTDARAAVGLAGGDNGVNSICNQVTSVPWTNLNNGYAATQFYDGVMYPDGQTYFGGTQDNGTIRGTSGGGSTWSTILGGDGGYVAVDPTTTGNPATTVLFGENTALSIRKSTNGGTSFASSISGITESGGNFLFIAPFIMDPGNSQRLWTGGFAMWRTTNSAGSWTQASVTTCGNEKVSAIAVAPADGNKVLSGMSDGCINRTSIGLTSTSATTWASVTPRNGYVSWLAFNPTNSNIAYATYASFNAVGTDKHVYRSTDSGASWLGIDGAGATGIPDIPVHTIVVDPVNTNTLYVGTDLGVFTTTDGGATWMKEITGFANVVTESLKINTVAGVKTLFAFTHGRGAWRVLPNGGTTTRTLTVASSNPSSGVSITVSPNDNNGQGNGVTQFTRTYNNNTVVNLTAPSTAGGNSFQKWQRDGVDLTTSTSTNVTMDANHTMTAVYIGAQQPDLTVTALTAPTTGAIGGQITVSTTVVNQGAANAGAFRLGFYFSTDSTITTGDTFTGWGCTYPSGLAAGASTSCDGPVGIPSSLPPGTYFFGAIADDLGAIAESNEANNSRAADTGPIVLTSQGQGTCASPYTIVRGHPFNGNTSGGQSVFGSYSCVGWSESGPERVHTITMASSGTLTASLSNLGGNDLDVFILSSCSSSSCLAFGDNAASANVGPGTYYILVDGFEGDVGGYTLTIGNTPFDFDGDGKSDVSVFRPSTGTWFIINSSNGSSTITGWGQNGDKPVAGDYDGDGETDIAVWRPSTGVWWIRNSSNGSTTMVGWGVSSDVPAPADYDGDGKTDIAVWRPATGTWFIINSSNGIATSQVWGTSGDKVAPADYDGDGKADVAVFRPATGTWFIINSSNGSTTNVGWGQSGDIPVATDFDGDGKADIAIWRPGSGVWWIRKSSNGSTSTVGWGISTDVPVPADYDGDGKSDNSVWRTASGAWLIINSSNGSTTTVIWGTNGDIPISARS